MSDIETRAGRTHTILANSAHYLSYDVTEDFAG